MWAGTKLFEKRIFSIFILFSVRCIKNDNKRSGHKWLCSFTRFIWRLTQFDYSRICKKTLQSTIPLKHSVSFRYDVLTSHASQRDLAVISQWGHLSRMVQDQNRDWASSSTSLSHMRNSHLPATSIAFKCSGDSIEKRLCDKTDCQATLLPIFQISSLTFHISQFHQFDVQHVVITIIFPVTK